MHSSLFVSKRSNLLLLSPNKSKVATINEICAWASSRITLRPVRKSQPFLWMFASDKKKNGSKLVLCSSLPTIRGWRIQDLVRFVRCMHFSHKSNTRKMTMRLKCSEGAKRPNLNNILGESHWLLCGSYQRFVLIKVTYFPFWVLLNLCANGKGVTLCF